MNLIARFTVDFYGFEPELALCKDIEGHATVISIGRVHEKLKSLLWGVHWEMTQNELPGFFKIHFIGVIFPFSGRPLHRLVGMYLKHSLCLP
jgi:hypothetical protein